VLIFQFSKDIADLFRIYYGIYK